MSTEQPQPEIQRTFTAAEFMHELARVSGADVSEFAPEMGQTDTVTNEADPQSSADGALRDYRDYEEEQGLLAERAREVLEWLTPDRANKLNVDPGTYFEHFVRALQGRVDAELIQYTVSNSDIVYDAANFPDQSMYYDPDKIVGLWISAMICAVPEPDDPAKDVEIHLTIPEDFEIERIGYGLRGRREVVIDGNLGNYAGEAMRGGRLEIQGSVDDGLGNNMWGGMIHVTKNARHTAGSNMISGHIQIDGITEGIVGDGAEDGTIRVVGGLTAELVGYIPSISGVDIISGIGPTELYVVKDGVKRS